MSLKLAILGLVCLLSVLEPVSSQSYKMVCYYSNWAQYRPEGGKFFPENIDPNLCTHIVYAFAKVDNGLLAPYEWNDQDTDWSKGMYTRVQALKAQNPNLKVLLAVGGWNHGSGPFSSMVKTAASRSKFVADTVTYLTKHKFDGLDLDWEYPANRENSSPNDKQLFSELCNELKAAFAPKRFLLTAAVAASKITIDSAYEVSKIAQSLDFINLMAYDLHGSWETKTGIHTALYARQSETGSERFLNVDWAVKYWISKGVPSAKLILGMATYGKGFSLASSSQVLGAPANGASSAGTYTREQGFLAYYEICQKIAQGWTKTTDSEHRTPYVTNGRDWVGFDDIASITTKANYVKANKLGGAMFWSVDLDDFDGKFCGQGKYPLLNAVKSVLNA